MTKVGYIWVGPLEHNSEYQRDLLNQRGAELIFEDISANISTPTRPQLTAALDRISEGDGLIIWRLDRLASTSSGVLSLLELLGRRGVGVTSIFEELDTAGDAGRPLLKIISAFNELERQLVRERTMVGVYAARARGRVAGRPRALSPTNVDRVLVLREQGATVREIAQELGTSRATIYRALETPGATDEGSAAVREEPQTEHPRFVNPPIGDGDGFALGNG
jgi:DNA invertase Pin-like site-specific DNA recombinase